MKRPASTSAQPDPRADLAADGLVSVAEACKFLGLGHSELYLHIASGAIASAKIGRRRLIPRRALVEFAARHLVAANPAD